MPVPPAAAVLRSRYSTMTEASKSESSFPGSLVTPLILAVLVLAVAAVFFAYTSPKSSLAAGSLESLNIDVLDDLGRDQNNVDANGAEVTQDMMDKVVADKKAMQKKPMLTTALNEGALSEDMQGKEVMFGENGKVGLSSGVSTESILPPNSPVIATGFLARVMLDSPEDVERALLRAEQYYQEGNVQEGDNPLAFVLHGPEVEIFVQENYEEYKSIVDLAARLSAFNVVDVTVCRTRLGALGENEQALMPFVKTVPFGPAEVERLLDDEEYVYF